MADLPALKAFDLASSNVTLWVFRKSAAEGGVPAYRGRWAETDDSLDTLMKQNVAGELARINEVIEYGLLAQNNEASALTISVIETHAGLVKEKAADALEDRAVRSPRDLENIEFYAFKFTGGGKTLYAVKKADATWKTRKKRNMIPILFEDHTITINDKPTFNIAKSVDFFIYDDDIFVVSKQNFESVLSYKAAHKDDFVALQAEQLFSDAFSSLDALLEFVGDNKIQLRRAAAIRQKGHYKNARFMERLKARHSEFGLTINFDASGKIVPSLATCRDIFQALLDHRLASAFSEAVYDVPDAAAVTV